MMDNYTRSKNTLFNEDALSFSGRALALFKKVWNGNTFSEDDLQKISDYVCDTLAVPQVVVCLVTKKQNHTVQNGRLRKKTLGYYQRCVSQCSSITIFKYTAIREKVISNKVALETLVHEICHHLDYEVIQLSKSIHSSGFYKRIGQVMTALKMEA